MKRVVALCGDPGGANAMAPVIGFLKAQSRLSVDAYAYVQAASLWSENGIEFTELDGAIGDEQIARILARPETALLLTGTSINRFELEKRFIAIARQLAIPSLAVVDFWGNYALRFRDAGGELSCLPDRIAVIDDLARNEAIEDKIEPSRIVVTGHPAWDDLARLRQEFSPGRRRAIREELKAKDCLVLFASQPPSFDKDSKAAPPPWLDRDRAVFLVIDALEKISRKRKKRISLLIRPHPREDRDHYRDTGSAVVDIIHEASQSSRELMLSCDLVIGLATMFMVESALLGRPTLSLRLGLNLPDPFPPNRSGLIKALYEEKEMETCIESLLLGNRREIGALPQRHACKNVAELAYALIERKGT